MEFVKPGMFGQSAALVEEPHEIENVEPAAGAGPAPAVSDVPDDSGEVKETAPNQEQQAHAAQQQNGVMHHLTYLGNGIWKDVTGQSWHHTDGKKGCIAHKMMSDKELQERPDIKFMIKYGVIKDVIVQ